MSKSEWKKLHMDQLVKRATAPPPASASGKPKLIKSELNQENDAADSSDNNDDCDDEKDTDSTSSDKRSIEGGGGKKQAGVYIVRCFHPTEGKNRDGIVEGSFVCTYKNIVDFFPRFFPLSLPFPSS